MNPIEVYEQARLHLDLVESEKQVAALGLTKEEESRANTTIGKKLGV